MAASRVNEMNHQHVPVLLNESVSHLTVVPNGTYVDATFGRGNHSLAILERLNDEGRVIAFDKDPEAVNYAKKYFAKEPRFKIFHCSFANMLPVLTELQAKSSVSGFLFDLGVSSPQLDNPDRGFSFLRPGILDMRMDTSQGIDARAWLEKVSEKELADILWHYGEERFSRRIARAIIKRREIKPISTTIDLAAIVSGAIPRPKKPTEKHAATRSFQAIRIVINQELSELEQGLEQALLALKKGGRLCVMSFHSLEDRIVKQFIKLHEKGVELPRRLPIKGDPFSACMKSLGKPVKANAQQVAINPRARSAVLRIAEKIL